MVDTTATSVLIAAHQACGPGHTIYEWLTPSTGAVRQVLGPPITSGAVVGDIPYPASPSGSGHVTNY